MKLKLSAASNVLDLGLHRFRRLAGDGASCSGLRFRDVMHVAQAVASTCRHLVDNCRHLLDNCVLLVHDAGGQLEGSLRWPVESCSGFDHVSQSKEFLGYHGSAESLDQTCPGSARSCSHGGSDLAGMQR